jgi:Zn-dependent protease with chaperone function
LGVALAACSTNPMTGRSQLSLLPESQVIAQGRQAYAAELKPWQAKGKINNDPALKARVDAITDRLIEQAIRYRPDTRGWNWQVAVIDAPKTLNAFCLPGGRMAIYSGLVTKIEASDDEIAQVMAHEIGHALANHGAEKMSVGMMSDILVAAVAGGNRGYQQVGDLAALLAWQLPNSRGAEREADRIGIEIAARAGYDPDAAVSLWKKMQAEGGDRGSSLLSTHPAPAERMTELAQLVPAMRPLYAEARASPPSAFTRLPVNARDITPGSELTPPVALKPLTLLSPALEQFKRGEALLPCDDCALGFQLRQGKLRALHAEGDWEALAREVLDVGYTRDIAWYYLGAAAVGLGHAAAARRYYAQAASLARFRETRCQGVLLDLCGGITLPEAAREGLKRLGDD